MLVVGCFLVEVFVWIIVFCEGLLEGFWVFFLVFFDDRMVVVDVIVLLMVKEYGEVLIGFIIVDNLGICGIVCYCGVFIYIEDILKDFNWMVF